MRGGACLAAKVIGRRVDDRIGVADERDRLGRTGTSSGSETAGGVLPRSRRKNEASRPTLKSSGAAPLARMFSLLG